jgi:hypothetical protein
MWPVPVVVLAVYFSWFLTIKEDQKSGEMPALIAEAPLNVVKIPSKDTTADGGEENRPTLLASTQDREDKISDGPGNKSQYSAIATSKTSQSKNANTPTITSETVKSEFQHSGYVVSENGAEALGLSEASQLHFLIPIAPSHAINHIDPTDIEKVPVEDRKIKKRSSFIIGIGYSPDFSTVGLDNYVAPGSRWKVYLEYNFKNIIALSTGAEWVNNKYEADGDEYHAPPLYWYNATLPEGAYGECKMIDIPLNVRYQAYSKGRHQLFVSAGASTYLLLKEDYYFDYYQNDPSLPDHWGTEKMTVYPFGIINASIGYEYLFNSRGSIQLEPYIKIPTKGVGWGNVDLYTVGAYISYRYRLWR